jgi:SAM-dependent methyltransferase
MPAPNSAPSGQKRFLNIGGGSKAISVSDIFAEWRHDLLDVDPACRPDVLLDARELHTLPAASYDAVYCAHNLEHYYPHDAVKVVRGMAHILKPDGFAEIRVPDLQSLFKTVVQNNIDIEDVLYESDLGPVRVRDVIYGFGPQIERSGNDFYAHKSGFTPASLRKLFLNNGFVVGLVRSEHLNVIGVFFPQRPTAEHQRIFGFSMPPAP